MMYTFYYAVKEVWLRQTDGRSMLVAFRGYGTSQQDAQADVLHRIKRYPDADTDEQFRLLYAPYGLVPKAEKQP